MPYKDEEKQRAYHATYDAEHREKILQYQQNYRLLHRQENREYARKYHQEHRERCNEQFRQRHLVHKKEDNEKCHQYALNLHQQFMDGVYGHLCFFCKQPVTVEELAKHHINGGGPKEREQLGGGTTGTIRSWKRAIAEQNPIKWATAHRSCHTAFHNIRRKKHVTEGSS